MEEERVEKRQGDERRGIVGSGERACLHACFYARVKLEIFIVHSAIQRAITFKLRAA